jgi:transcriptional regulator with XRE-family HTH domain
LRSVLNLKAKAFAELVGVSPETVSRWENRVRSIDAAAWAHLCSMVLDKAAGTSTTLDRLRATAEVRERRIPSRRHVLKSA